MRDKQLVHGVALVIPGKRSNDHSEGILCPTAKLTGEDSPAFGTLPELECLEFVLPRTAANKSPRRAVWTAFGDLLFRWWVPRHNGEKF